MHEKKILEGKWKRSMLEQQRDNWHSLRCRKQENGRREINKREKEKRFQKKTAENGKQGEGKSKWMNEEKGWRKRMNGGRKAGRQCYK